MKSHPNMPDVYLPHPVTVSHERFPNLLISVDGTAYVDFLGQDGCTFLHAYGSEHDSHAGRVEHNVLFRALNRNICTTNFLDQEEKGKWATKVCALTGYDKVLPLCSGSEANDAAMKLALKRHFLDHKREGRVIALDGGYFGRTVGANSCNGDSKYQRGMGGWDRVGVVEREQFLTAVLANALRGDLAGVIMEVLPGRDLEGGFLEPDFVLALDDLRQRFGFAIIIDEIKTGGGRMGRFLASHMWEDIGVKPDIVTMSKTLASGLPIAAVLSTNDMFSGIDYTWHTSTMGGNPAICRYSRHLMDKVNNEMLLGIRSTGNGFRLLLEEKGFDFVGTGLHMNIFLDNAFRVRDRLCERGWLVYCIHDDFIALYPNMYTTNEQLGEFVEVLSKCVS